MTAPNANRRMSEWRFNTFVDAYRDAKTWPREGASKMVLMGPELPEKPAKLTTMDGYAYLQSVVSHFCTHRKHRTSMALTAEQLLILRHLPWMNDYLQHLANYHDKYGSRDKHPTTHQKIQMLKLVKEKPSKEDRILVHDPALVPKTMTEYEFDARRFMDAVIPNWKKAWDIPVSRIPIELSDERMDEIMTSVPWFYDFVFSILRKKKKIQAGATLLVSDRENRSHEAACHRLAQNEALSESDANFDDDLATEEPPCKIARKKSDVSVCS
tara:strand:- start:48 stop:857 length:810 start_codon:yes stop_codon:yes gene_type:complete